MSKSYFALNQSISFNPWIYFFIFLMANVLLSYFTLTLETSLWIGILGLIMPFIIGLWTYKPSKNPEIPLYKLEFFKKIPFWIWIAVAGLALFFRFYKLTTLSAWPIYDEGMIGFGAMRIAQKGIEQFFYMFSDLPVFYLWFLSVFFKLWGPSLFNLWFWPAVFSTLFAPLTYFAARNYFSKSFSFFCTLLASVAFWPCYTGRFSAIEVLILPLETLAFLLLGKCLQSESPRKGDWFAGVLGLSLGLSFYAVFLHWISVTFIIGSTMMLLFWKRRPLRLALFGLGLALPLIPFIVICLKTGGVSYLHSQSILSMPQPLLKKMEWAWNTPRVIFWGAVYEEVCYRPVWGGLVNPVLGALLGVGILESLKNLIYPLYRWLFVAFLIFLLPGMLSLGFEFFRVVPILLVIIPIIGLGWARLTQEFSVRWSTAILLLLMIPSLALDFHQLMDIYPHLWDSPAYWTKEIKSINHYRAYKILQSKSSEGPGLIFSDFVPGFDDQAINLADYQFNGVNNDHLDWEKAKWAALIINVNYQPFLVKRFGPAKTYWLSKDLNSADGGWMLWIIDITEANRPIFRQWREASRSLNNYIYQNLQDLSPADNQSYSKVLDILNKIYPSFEGDSFLETCYWEKKADLFYKIGRIPDAVQSVNQALQRGYPAANLFYRLGTLQMIQKNEPESQEAFRKAIHAPINFTQSAQFLSLSSRKTNVKF